ncbi:MAG: hypothetical protein GY719_19010 [bacterium]|nr:hypothetical protein [bacterium]
MPHSKKYAQKLLRELPVDVGTLLEQPRYWDETFLWLYLGHCDDVLYHHPEKGLKLAVLAPRLSELVPERSGSEGQRIHRELRVRSNAVYGGALRGAGTLDEAEAAFQTALQICEREDVPTLEESNLHHRLAVLRITQRKFDEAFELCRGAIKTYRTQRHDEYLGEALVIQGIAFSQSSQFAEAILHFGEALQLTKNKNTRTYHSAIHCLALAFTKTDDDGAVKSALRWIREAKRRLRNHRRSLPKHKLTWIEGMIYVKVCLERHGERLFWRAREGFLDVGAPFELALVGLSLSEVLCRQERWGDLKELAADTFGRFRLLSADTESIAVLSLWMDAVRAQKLEDQVIADVRQKLERRMRRQPLPGARGSYRRR